MLSTVFFDCFSPVEPRNVSSLPLEPGDEGISQATATETRAPVIKTGQILVLWSAVEVECEINNLPPRSQDRFIVRP